MTTSHRTAPRLPARAVLQFGGRIFLHLAVSLVLGLAAMKGGQWLLAWSDADAVRFANLITFGLFAASFLLRPVPLPEIDYGPDDGASLVDE